MNDLEILQELNLSVYITREHADPSQPEVFVVSLSEAKANFSEAHQAQLTKIMSYLGFTENEYSLCFADMTPHTAPTQLLAFGQTTLEATDSTHTHSISEMLQNPAIKREVLHAIQALRRNA